MLLPFAMLSLVGLLPSAAECQQDTQEPAVDTIIREGGRESTGILLYLGDEEVLLLDHLGRRRTIKRKDIQSMQGPRADYEAYLSHLDLVYSARATANDALQLAKWAPRHGYLTDATLHWWRTLELDPANKAAHLALGHRREGEQWLVAVGQQELPYEEAIALHAEKDSPWEFRTAHVHCIANGRLSEVLRATATAERVYGHLLAKLRETLPAEELLTPIELRLFADRRQAYPEAGENRMAWIDPLTHLAGSWFNHGDADHLEEICARAFFRGMVRQLSHGEAEELPAWLDEGLGMYFQVCLRPTEGLPDYHPGRLDVDHCQEALGEEDEPPKLSSLLSAPRDHLADLPDPLAARGAAYALLYFLWENEDPKVLKGFSDYLAKALEDRGGASNLHRALPRRFDRKLESTWTDFLRKSVLRRRQG